MNDENPSRTKLLEEVGKMCRQLAKAERALEHQKDIEKAFNENQAKLQNLLNRLTECAFVLHDGIILFANKALSKLVDIPIDDLVQHPVDDRLLPLEELQRIAGHVVTDEDEAIFLTHLIHSKGHKIPVSINVSMFHDTLGKVIVGVVHVEKNRDSSLNLLSSQSQKLETLGAMAGGIAHDMNNIIGAIMNIASVMREEGGLPASKLKDLDTILAATRRGRDLTRSLLRFAGNHNKDKEYLSMNQVIQEVTRLLKRTIPKDIKWNLDLEDPLSSVYGVYGQLSHIMMNICINAADATKNGGVITLSTRKVKHEKNRLELHGNMPTGDYVLVQVIDTGEGMDSLTTSRIFEPFYSTKDPDKGTGLGLAMVKKTIEEHSGTIHLESVPGAGTVFSIYLPVAMKKKADLRKSGQLKPIKQVGSGIVLLVDDDELIRDSTKRILTKLGYTVILAANGKEAVKIYRKEKKKIVLVIMDIMMPEMDGQEAFFEIRKINPHARVLLASGYACEEKVEEMLESGAMAFMQKPFDLQTFTDGVLYALKG